MERGEPLYRLEPQHLLWLPAVSSRPRIVFTEAFDYNAPTVVSVRLGVRHRNEHTGRRGKDTMNGAESLVRTLVGGGVNVCFTNPGTSEMHFVAALDKVEGMRCVLALFEGW